MKTATITLILLYFTLSPPEFSQEVNEVKELSNLVTTFLSNVESREMHDRLLAEELIYTSSSGERFGKSTIMDGFNKSSKEGGYKNL